MKRHMGREQVMDLLQMLASFYCEHRNILNKDDRHAFTHAHRVIEELSKSKKYNPTKEYDAVDIDMSEFEREGVISAVAEQNAYWGNGANVIELEE